MIMLYDVTGKNTHLLLPNTRYTI